MESIIMILAACIFGLVVGLLNPDASKPKKPWKPKKGNFFVRIGEQMGDSYW